MGDFLRYGVRRTSFHTGTFRPYYSTFPIPHHHHPPSKVFPTILEYQRDQLFKRGHGKEERRSLEITGETYTPIGLLS